MTLPATAAAQFAASLLIGCVLGIVYGFLRPLRPRHTALSDLLFLPAAVYGVLYIAFAVAKGDLRPEHLAGIFIGGFLWEWLPGRWLRPVFCRIWMPFWKILGYFSRIFKKFFEKIKKIFHFPLGKRKKNG